VVTQERSKAVRETENPFGEDVDEPASPPPVSHASSSRQSVSTATQPTGRIESFSSFGSFKDKPKKDKDKKNKKSKPFVLEAEKEKMKSTIADSSMAATALNNALQSINRERERISENQLALQRFEACKHLRRKVLYYVRQANRETILNASTDDIRSITLSPSNGSVVCCMQTMSWSRL